MFNHRVPWGWLHKKKYKLKNSIQKIGLFRREGGGVRGINGALTEDSGPFMRDSGHWRVTRAQD